LDAQTMASSCKPAACRGIWREWLQQTCGHLGVRVRRSIKSGGIGRVGQAAGNTGLQAAADAVKPSLVRSTSCGMKGCHAGPTRRR
jgi:hypothetical protein